MAISLLLEDRRISNHLKRVEAVLRAKDTSALTATAQSARAENLNHLHDYWLSGQFPRNTDRYVQRVPCFIDRTGRTCAVAYLMVKSGNEKLAERVDQMEHNSRLRRMNVPGLADWVEQSGLTLDELALIQPGYDAGALLGWADVIVVPAAVIIGLIAGLIIRYNWTGLHKNRRRIDTILAIIIGLICAGAAAYVLLFAIPASITMIRYYFGFISTSDLGTMGTGTLAPTPQAKLTLPLLALVLSTLVILLTGIGSLVSSLRTLQYFIKGLKRSS